MPVLGKSLAGGALVGLLCCWGAASAAADPPIPAVYEALHDFNIGANPNGAWSYLANGILLAVPSLPCGNYYKKVECWWTDRPVPDNIVVARNRTNQEIVDGTVHFPVHYLMFDPENGSVTVRWTAPAAGNYSILGDFLGADTYQAEHPVAIVLDGTDTIFSNRVSRLGQRRHFSFDVTVGQGETLDFSTQFDQDYRNLSSGVRARIIGPN